MYDIACVYIALLLKRPGNTLLKWETTTTHTQTCVNDISYDYIQKLPQIAFGTDDQMQIIKYYIN